MNNYDAAILSAKSEDANVLRQAGVSFEPSGDVLFFKSEDQDKIKELLPQACFGKVGETTSYPISLGTNEVHTVWRRRRDGEVGMGVGAAPRGCDEIGRFHGAADAFSAFTAFDKEDRAYWLKQRVKKRVRATLWAVAVAIVLTLLILLFYGASWRMAN